MSARGATPEQVRTVLDAVWRLESARVVATVARRVRDLGVAEELAQDAWLAAWTHWPREGLPERPAAWLMTTAQHRALDWLRHRQMAATHGQALAEDQRARQADRTPDHADGLDVQRERQRVGGDELMRLLFIACHPVLSPEQQVALTLKVLCGLSTAEIARSCLVSEATLAQRLVRAKRSLAQAQVPFALPPDDELASRLASVLAVACAVFNEGYTATAGPAWMRPTLCQESLRLVRQLARWAPDQAEVWGLLALLDLQASRLPARLDDNGRPVLLPEQDRSRWDRALLAEGLQALAQARQVAARLPGPYLLQAELAAVHARAARVEETDWAEMVRVYDQLMAVAPSPVVALNRAVALGQWLGPSAALPLVEALQAEPALARYPWREAVRADLLARLGRHAEARLAWAAAAALSENEAERALLCQRAAAPAPPGSA